MKASALLAVAVLGLSCSDDPLPVCPTGDCSLPGSTTVKWKFNHYPEWGFDSDACSDVGAVMVHVEAANQADPTMFETVDQMCGAGQATFVGLAPGMYDVSVTPLDLDGNPLVKAAVPGEVLAGSSGAPTETEVDVPYDAWSQAYTGTLLFRLSFGGASCPTDVKFQILQLTIGGQIVNAMTDGGQLVDGVDKADCRPLTEEFAQFIQGLPFGPATMKVQGTAQNNDVLYEQEFDTFIGAGQSNPPLTYDITPPDAPIDAPVDADVDAMVDAM